MLPSDDTPQADKGSACITDGTPPTLAPVTIASDNPNGSQWARVGDMVTVRFTASEPIRTPVVTLFGSAASVTNVGGNQWAASAPVSAGTVSGAATFSISYSDLADNAGTAVTATTDGTAVTVDKVTLAPTTSTASGKTVTTTFSVTLNLTETPLAGSAQLIFTRYGTQTVVGVLTLDPTEHVAGNRTVRFDPRDPGASPQIADGAAAIPDGDYSLTISYQDAAGNAAATVSISLFHIDATPPMLAPVTVASSNPLQQPAWVNDGQSVSVTFTSSEDHLTLVAGSTIGGRPATLSMTGTLKWRTTAQMTAAVPEGPVAFSIAVKDDAGNQSAPLTATTDGSVVRLDRTAPVVTVPAPVAEATSADGATVNYTIGIQDNLDPAPTLRDFGPQSGDVFPLGMTPVTARVFDAAGNETHQDFVVTVVDTTAPVLSGVPVGGFALEAGPNGFVAVPSVYAPVLIIGGGGGITLSKGTPGGVAQTLIKTGAGTIVLPPGGFGGVGQGVTATDAVGVTNRTQVPAAGTVLPLGVHMLTLTVSDAAGNNQR